jgi:hypothetical protein
MKQRWLQDWPWETVTAINAGLCKEKNALHKLGMKFALADNQHEPARANSSGQSRFYWGDLLPDLHHPHAAAKHGSKSKALGSGTVAKAFGPT